MLRTSADALEEDASETLERRWQLAVQLHSRERRRKSDSESDAHHSREEMDAHLNKLGCGAPEGEPVVQRDASVVLQVAGVAHRVPRRPAARLERRARRTGRLVEQQLEVGPLDDAVVVSVCANATLVHVVLVLVLRRAEAEGKGTNSEQRTQHGEHEARLVLEQVGELPDVLRVHCQSHSRHSLSLSLTGTRRLSSLISMLCCCRATFCTLFSSLVFSIA